MTDAPEGRRPEEPSREGIDDLELPELPEVSALLKRSLGSVRHDDDRDRFLLASVQRKLRQRSKGKFYADGWSTGASRVNYALVAAVMLVVIVAVYLTLGPTGVSFH